MNIVLIEPEIPNNTGNIGRLALGTNCTLHLVKPFGFEITDTRLKRAGLDYWQHLNVVYYNSTADFFAKNTTAKMVFLSSKANKMYYDIDFTDDIFLVFGKESVGLDDDILKLYENNTFKIPLYTKQVRGYNIGNAVSAVVFEGIRQIHFLK